MLSSLKKIFSLLIFLMLFVASVSVAQSTTHKVESGETLFSIAEANGVSIQQLKTWNNLKSSSLSIGQSLIIKKGTDTNSSDSGITHTVKPKETLFSISKKYGVTIAEIKSWNNLQDQSLAIGLTLKIYPEKSTNASSAQSSNTTGSYYTVKSGDSLFRIANIHNMSVEQLKRLNSLSSNNIRVGQRLAVQATDQPPSLAKTGVKSSSQGKFIRYEIKKRQSRAELLETFQMDETEFLALNTGLTASFFSRGDKVNILAPPTRVFSNPYTTNNSLNALGSTSVTEYEQGRIDPTTSGELYNADALTAAHANIAMGSVIFIKNDGNKHGVYVRINDRITGNGLKLSKAAWNTLGLTGSQASVTMYRAHE